MSRQNVDEKGQEKKEGILHSLHYFFNYQYLTEAAGITSFREKKKEKRKGPTPQD